MHTVAQQQQEPVAHVAHSLVQHSSQHQLNKFISCGEQKKGITAVSICSRSCRRDKITHVALSPSFSNWPATTDIYPAKGSNHPSITTISLSTLYRSTREIILPRTKKKQQLRSSRRSIGISRRRRSRIDRNCTSNDAIKAAATAILSALGETGWKW